MAGGAPAWSIFARNLRTKRRLSRLEFAELTGVSAGSVKAYETGRRRPRLSTARRVLDAIRADERERAGLAAVLGYRADALSSAPLQPAFEPDSVQSELNALLWPAFVINDSLELVTANVLLERLWGLCLREECPRPWQRNALRILSLPQLRQHLGNWQEIVTMLLGVYKALPNPEDLQRPTRYLERILADLNARVPDVTGPLLRLWEDALPLPPPGPRTVYDITWLGEAGALRFRGVGMRLSSAPQFGIHEWHPANEAAWGALRGLNKPI